MTRSNVTKHCGTTCSSLASDFNCNPDDITGIGAADLADDEDDSYSCKCNSPLVFDEIMSQCVNPNGCTCYDDECDEYVNGTNQETCCPGRTWFVAPFMVHAKFWLLQIIDQKRLDKIYVFI